MTIEYERPSSLAGLDGMMDTYEDLSPARCPRPVRVASRG